MVLADLLVTGAVLVLLFTLQPHSGQGVFGVGCHMSCARVLMVAVVRAAPDVPAPAAPAALLRHLLGSGDDNDDDQHAKLYFWLTILVPPAACVVAPFVGLAASLTQTPQLFRQVCRSSVAWLVAAAHDMHSLHYSSCHGRCWRRHHW